MRRGILCISALNVEMLQCQGIRSDLHRLIKKRRLGSIDVVFLNTLLQWFATVLRQTVVHIKRNIVHTVSSTFTAKDPDPSRGRGGGEEDQGRTHGGSVRAEYRLQSAQPRYPLASQLLAT